MKNKCHIYIQAIECPNADKYGRCSIKPDKNGLIRCKKKDIRFLTSNNVPNPYSKKK